MPVIGPSDMSSSACDIIIYVLLKDLIISKPPGIDIARKAFSLSRADLEVAKNIPFGADSPWSYRLSLRTSWENVLTI